MEWTLGEPKYGDIVRCKVSFYYHYGIFVNENRIIQFGLPTDPGRPAEEIKVLVSDIYTFLNGAELEIGVVDKAESKIIFSPEKRVENAEELIGTGGYDILHNNCEHFVNKCAFGESKSSFLDGVREKLRQKLCK